MLLLIVLRKIYSRSGKRKGWEKNIDKSVVWSALSVSTAARVEQPGSRSLSLEFGVPHGCCHLLPQCTQAESWRRDLKPNVLMWCRHPFGVITFRQISHANPQITWCNI